MNIIAGGNVHDPATGEKIGLLLGVLALLFLVGASIGVGGSLFVRSRSAEAARPFPVAAALEGVSSKTILIHAPKSESLSMLRRANGAVRLPTDGPAPAPKAAQAPRNVPVVHQRAPESMRDAVASKPQSRRVDADFAPMRWKSDRWRGSAGSAAHADAPRPHAERHETRSMLERLAGFVAAPEFSSPRGLTAFKGSRLQARLRDAAASRLRGVGAPGSGAQRALGSGLGAAAGLDESLAHSSDPSSALQGATSLPTSGEGLTGAGSDRSAAKTEQVQARAPAPPAGGSGGKGGCPSGSHDVAGSCVADSGAGAAAATVTPIDTSYCGGSCPQGQRCVGVCGGGGGNCGSPHCETAPCDGGQVWVQTACQDGNCGYCGTQTCRYIKSEAMYGGMESSCQTAASSGGGSGGGGGEGYGGSGHSSVESNMGSGQSSMNASGSYAF